MPRRGGFGGTQRIVLRLLSLEARSPKRISNDGFGLTESGAYSALNRLAERGLVDRRYDSGCRETVYFLTAKGFGEANKLDGVADEVDR